MIKTRDDLQDYLDKDKRALGMKKRRPFLATVSGGGLKINHYGLIVVHPLERIGEWCDIHQGVNIGQNIEKGSVPVIGDNVWIGPGVKMFGKIALGDNMMLGAGAIVNKSFEEGNCTIAGNPAIRVNDHGNVWFRE